MSDDFASRAEVAALRRELRELKLYVGQLALRRQGEHDPRLGTVLALIHRYAKATTWTASQLLMEAGRDDRRLWDALDAICGPGGDPVIRLGRFLQRNADIDVNGLRLTRIKPVNGCWVYGVNATGE